MKKQNPAGILQSCIPGFMHECYTDQCFTCQTGNPEQKVLYHLPPVSCQLYLQIKTNLNDNNVIYQRIPAHLDQGLSGLPDTRHRVDFTYLTQPCNLVHITPSSEELYLFDDPPFSPNVIQDFSSVFVKLIITSVLSVVLVC